MFTVHINVFTLTMEHCEISINFYGKKTGKNFPIKYTVWENFRMFPLSLKTKMRFIFIYFLLICVVCVQGSEKRLPLR